MKIGIDAGHGSNTSGKRTPDGYREHYANVMVALFFANAMERHGINYIKTGWNDSISTDDVDTSIANRQKAIKNAGCDYSISFHFNAYGDGTTYNSAEGVETIISNKSPKDSKRLAELVQSELIKGTTQKNRGVKSQSLGMCNCSVLGTKASILVECAFMTNKREAELMESPLFCKECAEDVARGFCSYIGIKYIEPGGTVSTSTETAYYPKYTGTKSGLIDCLKAVGVTDTSFSFRKKIANANGIKLYIGSAAQNNSLVALLKEGKLKKAI